MVTLILPFPPSVNEMFFNTTNKRGRGRVKSSKYQAWVKEADASFAMQKANREVGHPVKGDFLIEIILDEKRRRHNSDLDNRLKATLDYVKRVGLIEDDCHAYKLTAWWGPADGCFVRIFGRAHG